MCPNWLLVSETGSVERVDYSFSEPCFLLHPFPPPSPIPAQIFFFSHHISACLPNQILGSNYAHKG